MAKHQNRVGVASEAHGPLLELSETLQDKADEFRNLAGDQVQEVAEPEKNQARESPKGIVCTHSLKYKYHV